MRTKDFYLATQEHNQSEKQSNNPKELGPVRTPSAKGEERSKERRSICRSSVNSLQ